jgi:hypothetical protein
LLPITRSAGIRRCSSGCDLDLAEHLDRLGYGGEFDPFDCSPAAARKIWGSVSIAKKARA